MNGNKSEKPKKKRALGRGLSALISSTPVPVSPTSSAAAVDMATPPSPQSPSTQSPPSQQMQPESPLATAQSPSGFAERIRYIDISKVERNPNQPRQTFSEVEISELSNSIKTIGVLQPILVRPSKDSAETYQIIAGERRWRAAKQAELPQIPVIIRTLDDRECLEISIVENVQRSDLSPIEEARAYKRLADEFSLSQRQIAEKVGKDRASVANYLRLLTLPEQVQKMLEGQKISMGHAKAILTVKEPAAQLSLARKVISENLSVRALEAIVSRVVVLEPKRKKKKAAASADLLQDGQFPEVLDRMRKSLATKVKISHHSSGRGKIVIEYFSEAELDRLVDRMCG